MRLIKGIITTVFTLAILIGAAIGGYYLGKSGLLDKFLPGQEVEGPKEENREAEELQIIP